MAKTAKPAGQPLHVLLIEDSPEDVELCLRELQKAGYAAQAEIARSFDKIASLLEQTYDLVLSDYKMPGGNGLGALQLVRQHPLHGETPFILVTGVLPEKTAVECLQQGVFDFILKEHIFRLPAAVRRVLTERALRRSQEELEARVAARTAALSVANESLQQSEQRFRLITEAIPHIVWTAEPDGSVNYCNARVHDYTGLALEPGEGWGWATAIHPDDVQECLHKYTAALQSGETYEAEYRLKQANDSSYRWHVGRTLPLRGPDGTIQQWLGTCTDIHDQKLAQQAQAQLAAMRENLVANVSHALRTPLASLRGFSELMLNREFSEAKRREFLTIIHKESERLNLLINTFLDLQRMESGTQTLRLETLNLEALIHECAALFGAPQTRHSLRLEIELPLPAVQADGERMHEVVGNLLSNALKYSPQGGVVVIGARAHGEEVLLWVRDQGMGIPAEAMPQLFSKFFRVQQAAGQEIKGTGLGLALVKQIVELHRGRVWAESQLGAGSTFFVALPRAHTPSIPGNSNLLTVSPSANGSEPAVDILIVEDDKTFANLLQEHFCGSLGFRVQHTAFAEEALENCQRCPPRMVLLDVHLAGAMDGWDMLVAIKSDARLQSIPVLMMIGSEPQVHGLVLRGADYIVKSASRQALMQAVYRQILDLRGKQVLVADQDAGFRSRLAALLEQEEAEVLQAASGQEALDCVATRVPDLLILDLLISEVTGHEVIRRLRHDRRAVNLRILVVTAKKLHLRDKANLQLKLASMLDKNEAGLEHFEKVVTETLHVRAPRAAAAMQAH